jgi:hypothetical protein
MTNSSTLLLVTKSITYTPINCVSMCLANPNLGMELEFPSHSIRWLHII